MFPTFAQDRYVSTTTHLGDVAIAETNEELIELLLQPREERLNHRAPTSRYVHRLRRELRSGKSKPVKMLLSIMAADLSDGVPLPVIERFVDEFRRSLRKLAGLRATACTRTLRTLLLNEARAQHARDLIEIELNADPNKQQLMERFAKATADLETANRALCEEVAARRTIIEAAFPQTRREKALVS